VARGKDFDLAAELAKPSFTPGQRDAPALALLIAGGDEPAATRAVPAIAKLGDAACAALDGAFANADDGAQARLVAALGVLARAGHEAARATVLARLGDPAVRVRRAAIVALGKLAALGDDLAHGDDARAALLARWDAPDVTADERRALAEALGKLGGEAALARLRALEPGGDLELARRRDRALLMADRSAKRDTASTIATDVTPPAPVTLRLGCKGGLAPMLVDELAALGVRAVAVTDAAVQLDHAGPIAPLFASRLWSHLAVRLPLDVPRAASPDRLADAVVRAMTAPAMRALLRAWTRGPIRWRLGFAKGHRRAVVWRVARDVTAAAPELVNDPTATTWDVLVDDDARTLELATRRLDDPRFAWRVAEVPAASHPTVAAALARIAEARPDDRVWDPFCGSGAELVERARLGPWRALIGSDVDEAALAATRLNAASAGVAIELAQGDARTYTPGPVDLVISNPPLGSRVQLDAAGLLAEALPNFVRQLAPGGRLVWITPSPRRTTPVAEGLGLVRTRAIVVDLGGVRGQLERWERR